MQSRAHAAAGPVVEILQVDTPAQLPQELRHARLNRPRAGDAGETFVIGLAGTVIPREGQARSVEIVSDGFPLREIPVSFPRAAVARTLDGVSEELPCGFRGLLSALRPEIDFELELRAVLDDGRRIPFATVKGRRERPHASVEPTLTPIMVTGLGRSGTTWLMGMLGGHPGIVVYGRPPYERFPARYWAHMLKVLCDPTEPGNQPRANLLDPDSPTVSPNPFYGQLEAEQPELGEWLGRTYVERLASFCLRNIEDWYATAARAQGKDGAVYFAEKNFLSRPRPAEPVAELYRDTREIFLVRDFRDVACSWHSYFGDRPVGQEKLRDDVLPGLVRSLAARWRSRRDGAHLVRYEDLVFRPAETLAGLFGYLEIDSAQRVIEDITRAGQQRDGFESHGTSPSLGETVGRWERTGDESFRAQLNESYGEALAEFGYRPRSISR